MVNYARNVGPEVIAGWGDQLMLWDIPPEHSQYTMGIKSSGARGEWTGLGPIVGSDCTL